MESHIGKGDLECFGPKLGVEEVNVSSLVWMEVESVVRPRAMSELVQ